MKLRKTNSIILYFWFVLTVLIALSSFFISKRATAQQPYQYDENHSFYQTWFMASEMPVVKHENTKKYCNQGCHWTFLPGLLPQKAWENQMENLEHHYGKSIILEPAIKQDIKTYLQSNAAEVTESKYSVKLLDSLKGRTPHQITSVRYITKTHHDLKPSVIRRQSIGSFSNCPACHIGVEETGNFQEKFVEIPEN